MKSVHLFGIRHHGPGSARSLCKALLALDPDCILIEGPPEGDEMTKLSVHEEMQPPVALLIYSPDDPTAAVYYPFALFSPEWQAITFGISKGIPVRFIDLPQTHWQALRKKKRVEQAQATTEKTSDTEDGAQKSPGAEEYFDVIDEDPSDQDDADDLEEKYQLEIRKDPLTWLAKAAGHSDGERWWEHMVEQRRDSVDLFEAIKEAMTTLRSEFPESIIDREIDDLREAHMRQMIRAAQKEGFQRIAVICGAWHTPALNDDISAKQDAALLKGLPKMRVEATWIPWTHGRLAFDSGYGAGVNSPGWYHHLWSSTDLVAERWLSHVAQLLRSEDLDASSASVIEATRLAECLAALRDRPLPGLIELSEATKAVLCFGNDVPMRLIHEKLIVGERLGTVPEITPTVPLQRDLQAEQKRLRMPSDAAEKAYDLDLRKENDLDRSRLLHRMRLLDIHWGTAETVRGKSGTFHELWRVKWQPEFSVKLIERGVWGRTIHEAATSFACDLAQKSTELAELTRLLEKTLYAELKTATEFVMQRVEVEAAIAVDVKHLMGALPPLAQIARYGDVRKTDLSSVKHIIDGLVARICVGLPGACSSLNDEAAQSMFDSLINVNSAIALLQNDEHFTAWTDVLRKISESTTMHGLIAGRACRVLLDTRQLTAEESATRFGIALSRAVEPSQAAMWAEGFLKGSGLLLVHNDTLWDVIDSWVTSLTEDHFSEVLPLLRRTFSTFTRPERKQMGQRAASGSHLAGRKTPAGDTGIDEARANKVLPIVARCLGLSADESVGSTPALEEVES